MQWNKEDAISETRYGKITYYRPLAVDGLVNSIRYRQHVFSGNTHDHEEKDAISHQSLP